ncbi:MAG: ribonuclease P protein component 4 [Candidatus Micrarchaeaceae archaeon]
MAAKSGGVARDIAAERIQTLYNLAVKVNNADPKLSTRYARLIKQIGKHYRIRLDGEIKRHICKKCGSFLVEGQNLSVRVASSKRSVVYKCLGCGLEARIPY